MGQRGPRLHPYPQHRAAPKLAELDPQQDRGAGLSVRGY